ncbi:hypothetical protein V8C37DRAFT_66901 [Trichoderma ceciliae]
MTMEACRVAKSAYVLVRAEASFQGVPSTGREEYHARYNYSVSDTLVPVVLTYLVDSTYLVGMTQSIDVVVLPVPTQVHCTPYSVPALIPGTSEPGLPKMQPRALLVPKQACTQPLPNTWIVGLPPLIIEPQRARLKPRSSLWGQLPAFLFLPSRLRLLWAASWIRVPSSSSLYSVIFFFATSYPRTPYYFILPRPHHPTFS